MILHKYLNPRLVLAAFVCSLLLGPQVYSQDEIKQAKAIPGEIANSIGMTLVLIQPGSFTMGGPNDTERFADEGPTHEVTISKPFYMGTHEVTQSQYEAVMGKNPSHFVESNNPVENVSWEEAVEFCKRLSKLTGERYRLPTEAEWEYACRAGTTTLFHWGDSKEDSVVKEYAWYAMNASDGFWTSPHAPEEGAQPVGQKKPNAWGLHDMNGNVWEWCSDWYDKYYFSKSPSVDPENRSRPAERERVLRGAGWSSPATVLRSTERHRNRQTTRDYVIGFRVVQDIQ